MNLTKLLKIISQWESIALIRNFASIFIPIRSEIPEILWSVDQSVGINELSKHKSLLREYLEILLNLQVLQKCNYSVRVRSSVYETILRPYRYRFYFTSKRRRVSSPRLHLHLLLWVETFLLKTFETSH